MFNLNLRVTLKKLNVITGQEKFIKVRLEWILFWQSRTIFCHSVTKYSWFHKIQWSNIQMLLTILYYIAWCEITLQYSRKWQCLCIIKKFRMSSFDWYINHVSTLNECWVMSSQRYHTFYIRVHERSYPLDCIQLVLCTADGECWRGWMRALVIHIDKLLTLLSRIDVNLSIWDRNFQNNNWFHIEISITIL